MGVTRGDRKMNFFSSLARSLCISDRISGAISSLDIVFKTLVITKTKEYCGAGVVVFIAYP